jgi:hypothetical protein
MQVVKNALDRAALGANIVKGDHQLRLEHDVEVLGHFGIPAAANTVAYDSIQRMLAVR